MISKLLLASSVLLLTGCSAFSFFESDVKPIETIKIEQERPKLNLPNPEPLDLKDIKWVIITRENAEEVFNEIEKSGQPVAIFGLTSEGYESLALNFADIKTYIVHSKTILIKYREYYEPESINKRDDVNPTEENQ